MQPYTAPITEAANAIRPVFDIAAQNARTFYESERSQGQSNMLLGIGLLGAGLYFGKWWLLVPGLYLAAFGYERSDRALTTYQTPIDARGTPAPNGDSGCIGCNRTPAEANGLIY